MGRTLVTEAVHTIDGEPALLQVLSVPTRGLVDSLLVRRRDLSPVWEHEHVRGLSIRVDYDGRKVRWSRQRGDSGTISGDTTFSVPVFAFNQLEMIVRSLPLRPGYTAVVPMLSEGSAELEFDTLTVLAAPQAAEVPWHIRFADSAVVSRYQLDGKSRDVVALEVVMREGGARYQRVVDAPPR